jgi:tRNA dimethylallyltransferase
VKATRDFNILKIGLHLPKDALHRNINTRVDNMIQQGLLEEVKTVLDFRNANALQTVGYKELFDFLDGKLGLEAAIEAIKLHTRQYAKRQLTWFRKDTAYTWLPPEAGAVMDFLKSQGIGTGV